MIVTADGHKFTVYIEGVRIPALSIVIDIAPVVTTVDIGIFAHETARNIKDGSVVSIFYTKAGLKESRLLFYGFLTSRSYSKTNDLHEVILRFSSRMAFLSRLHTAIYGKTSYTSCTTQATTEARLVGESSERVINGSMGVGVTDILPYVRKENDGTNSLPPEDVGKALNGVLTTQVEDKAVTKSSRKESTLEDINVKLHPFGNFTEAVKYAQPIKSLIDKIIKDTCYSSGEFNKVTYEDRYLLGTYISEMPGGWTDYFFGEADPGTDDKATLGTSFLAMLSSYLEHLGADASLSDVYLTTMGLLMFESYEVPGLLDGAQQLLPESIHSDIPMCNVIWPDMCMSVQYNEDSSRRVSRLIYSSPIVEHRVEGERTVSNSVKSKTALGIYPAVDLILAEKETSALKYNNVVYLSEIYNGISTYTTKFPMTYLQTLDPVLLAELAEYSYVNISRAYSSCTAACHFYPEVLPGLNAVVNDGMWRGVGKVKSIRHSIYPGREAVTNLALANYIPLDEYKYVIPKWYSDKYYPENINELYYTNYGVNSVGGFLKNEGLALPALIEELNKMYEETSVKSYMASKLQQRKFVSQEEFFKRFNCEEAQRDGTGVVIYTGKVFDTVVYDAYTNDGVCVPDTEADRQQAVVDYLKATYGRPAVKV